jgi:hypothetical protein
MNSKTYCFEAWSAEKVLELEVDDNAGLCRRSVTSSYTFNNSDAYCCDIVSWKDASFGFSHCFVVFFVDKKNTPSSRKVTLGPLWLLGAVMSSLSCRWSTEEIRYRITTGAASIPSSSSSVRLPVASKPTQQEVAKEYHR